MAHPSHKIAGPMLRDIDLKTQKTLKIATPEEVRHALTFPQAWVPVVIADEWVNEAKRKNGLLGTSERAGMAFRADQELLRRPKAKPLPKHKSRLQRLARHISRLFRKH